MQAQGSELTPDHTLRSFFVVVFCFLINTGKVACSYNLSTRRLRQAAYLRSELKVTERTYLVNRNRGTITEDTLNHHMSSQHM